MLKSHASTFITVNAQIKKMLGDLTEEEVCKKIVEDTVAHYGQLDVLVSTRLPLDFDWCVTMIYHLILGEPCWVLKNHVLLEFVH